MPTALSTGTALAINNLSKCYADGFEALKGIDLNVQEGDFFALLGPNGAGKSTTIGIISSLVEKTGGSVEIFGHNIDKDFARAKMQLGVVPQEFNFNQFDKVFDVLVNQAGYYGLPRSLACERAEFYLQKLGLWDKRDSTGRALSGGMKRRLMIARALVHHPRLLILDEPTAGVDIEMRRAMWAFLEEINRQGTTIILTTHYLEEAESLCRNIAIINHGEIAMHANKRDLLAQLRKEAFILDSRQPLTAVPELLDYDCKLLDEHTLEVVVDSDQDINALFTRLTAANIRIDSMRNKANRLEELFLNLVGQSNANQS